MSQYGAQQMALDGSGWRDIITHYYTGVTVAAYTPEELSGWLADAGFAQIEQFGNLRLEAPENTELRIFFAAKKG